MNQYALLLRGIQESEHMLPTFLNAVLHILLGARYSEVTSRKVAMPN